MNSEDFSPSPNPFADEGFKLSSLTAKCCCVAVRIGDTVEIRDTKNPNGPTLSFNKEEWKAFIERYPFLKTTFLRYYHLENNHGKTRI